MLPQGIEYPALWVASPGLVEAWIVERRPDCRRLVCDRCSVVVYLCSWCDRGQRYCSSRCSGQARRASLRAAGDRYQRTPRGRRLHSRRQQAYRERQRKKVTHHGCRREEGSASVAECEPSRVIKSAGRRSTELRCAVCASPCERLVRHDFLRSRRPRWWRREARSDQRAAGGRDSPSV